MKRPHASKSSRATLKVVTLIALGLGLLIPGLAVAQTELPLTGEQLAGVTFHPPSEFECDSERTYSYAVTGEATGPYPGPFTETGTFSYTDTQPLPSGPGDFTGPVATLNATFEIDSINGFVTGTKTLPMPEFPGGGCVHVPPFNQVGASALLSYEALIQTPTGAFVDRGQAQTQVTLVWPSVGDPHHVLLENFTSREFGPAANPPTSNDDCKNEGWRTRTDDTGRPFKNQGDCVSYVSSGGKNKADG